jgi:hypothetical protein
VTRSAATSLHPIRWPAALTLAILLASALHVNVARAQVIERGVQGGVAGAIIGGIIGGGRGAGTGAAIGAGVGIITGAAEADADTRARAAYAYGTAPGAPPLVYSIQQSLTRLGYDPGPVDGVYCPGTADAISRYQYASRLSVDGQPSPQLLNLMISQGG